jgi:hypothetical protein
MCTVFLRTFANANTISNSQTKRNHEKTQNENTKKNFKFN